jgi:methylated-DNA-protein-cysteine methyltransferase-like protein
VRTAVRSIPHGNVASYGAVAAVVGQPRAARAVGRALCTLDDDVEVPWWRVINRNGEISIKCTTHGPALQRALLRGEGVRFDAKGRVSWERFGWDGSGVPAGIREDDTLDEPAVIARAKGVVPDRVERRGTKRAAVKAAAPKASRAKRRPTRSTATRPKR